MVNTDISSLSRYSVLMSGGDMSWGNNVLNSHGHDSNEQLDCSSQSLQI